MLKSPMLAVHGSNITRLQPEAPAHHHCGLQPTTSTISVAMASTKPKLWIYLDYNGVLNQEGERALNEFILKLDFLDDWFGIDTVIVLLSFRKEAYKCNCTLNELADAGVLDLFQKLVFTAVRSCKEEGRPVDSMRCAIVEEFEYEPLSPHKHPPLPASPRNQDSHEFRLEAAARQRFWRWV